MAPPKFDDSLKHPCLKKITNADSPLCGHVIGQLNAVQIKDEIVRLQRVPTEVNSSVDQLGATGILGAELLRIVEMEEALELIGVAVQMAKERQRQPKNPAYENDLDQYVLKDFRSFRRG